MKKTLFVSLMLTLLTGTVWAQDVEDDLYYTPKKKTQTKTTTTATKPATEVKTTPDTQVNVWAPKATTVVVRDRQGNERDVDEYNRRYTSKENTFTLENDTLYIDEREDSDLRGEWVNGFDGTEDDYEYAVRIIRFQNPRYAIPVSSPLYWDVVYGLAYTSWDWNVYDDGLYAYVFPTFSNPLWWNWRYDYSWRWRFGWHYWDYPYYYGWGWHYPYHHHYHWYAHGPHWGWGGGHHWNRPAYRDERPVTVYRGHDRSNRYSSGTLQSNRGTRYTGTRVDGNRTNSSTRRFDGVQGYRSTGSSNSVRQSVNGTRVTRPNSQGTGTSTGRSTSSYVRPNSVRVNNNTYSRPSSTRSSNYNNSGTVRSNRNNNSSYQRSNNSSSYRSYDSGTSVRSSGFSGGSNRSSGMSGGSRSGGGRSRR